MERAASGVWNGLAWVTKSIVKPWQKHHHHHHHDHGPQDRRLGFTATQRRRIAAVVLLSYLLYPGVVLAQAVGTNVEAATGSAHAPQITQSQNKTTVVNINQASAAGVSRNQYNQFNVGPNGLILNNSTAITQTQLAGYIDGNAALKGRSARIILNEVVSANPSQLRAIPRSLASAPNSSWPTPTASAAMAAASSTPRAAR